MHVLAIDLGGSKAAFAVVDRDGRIAARTKRPSHENGGPLSFEALVRAAEETLDAAGRRWSDLEGAGIILPGIYDVASGHAWAPNLWGDTQVDVLQPLSRLIPTRLVIDSDRSGYVLGETWLGAARGCTDAVFVGVGTGIGAGLLCGGRVVRGAAGIAGAVGWFATDPSWTPQGTLGCWEAKAAAPALAQRAGLRDGKAVTDAARNGDAAARQAVNEAAEALAMGIANLISALNPQVVVLGGGLMQASDLFLEPIRRAVPRWAQPIAARQCRIVPSALGQDAGLFGAARLALSEGNRA